MNKRKIVSLFVASVLSLGLFGCFGSNTTDGTTDSGTTDNGTTDNGTSGGTTGGTVSTWTGTQDDRLVDSRGLTAEEYTAMNTVGTDALGRIISEADDERGGNRYVGIWYSLWHGQHTYMQSAIYDNEKLLSTPEGAEKLDSDVNCEETRVGEFHFCCEPLYGYYNMEDPWVVARHIELLTAAGVDYVCFDATNATIYTDVAKLVLETLQKYQNQGFKVPKAMFYVNSYAGTTARRIYSEFYQTNKYDDVWFSPNGKPLMCGITSDNRGASDQVAINPDYTDVIPSEYSDRLEIRESQWPQGIIEHENAIPWMSWKYPQSIHANTNSISVSVAQHDPYRINFSYKGEHSSRGYDHITRKLYSNYQAGQNFESQWQTVFNYESQGRTVENVMLCGWNEWMAVKSHDGNEAIFCDVYNEEYSRDIEMMKGNCGDNFYLQMIRNIREYKYTDGEHYKYQKISIDMSDTSLSQWEGVRAHYRDFSGDAMERNYLDAVDKDKYQDYSNRNDITDVKVVHDSSNLYIYVKTNGISEYNGTDKNWMTVLIGNDSGETNFETYQYIINRSPDENGNTSIEKCTGGYNWQTTGSAQYQLYSSDIQSGVTDVIVYKIPLSSLGLSVDSCHIRLKVTDNVQNPADIMDYYISGDCAPIGRLSYSYGY